MKLIHKYINNLDIENLVV